MKIIFFGTPDYVVPIVDKLHKTFRSRKGESPIVAVVTQRPAPAGREQKITYSPIDKWAYEHKVPILYKSEDVIKENVEADMGVCAAFGEIIPKSAISHFRFGILNVHPSILPKYRGASPVQGAILSGDSQTGVSIIKMDEKVDHGPIVSQFKKEVRPEDTTETLRARLFENSAEVLTQLIEPYLQGKITPREQNHKEATFTSQIKKQDGFILPEYLKSASQGEALGARFEIKFIQDNSHHSLFVVPDSATLGRFIRAMQPWPQAWTKLENGKRLKILKAHLEEEPRVINHKSLVLDEVQLEGKTPVSYEEFKRGYPKVELAKD